MPITPIKATPSIRVLQYDPFTPVRRTGLITYGKCRVLGSTASLKESLEFLCHVKADNTTPLGEGWT